MSSVKEKSILFLSHLIPKEYDEDIKKFSKKNMQDAANTLQWHILNGLSDHLDGNLDVLNLITVGSYPQNYEKAFICTKSFDCGTDRQGINVGFCNIRGIRRRSIRKNIYSNLKKWCIENSDTERLIVVYSLHSSLLGALSKLKEDGIAVHICAIVADLPDMINLSSEKSLLSSIVHFKVSKASLKRINIVDSFVFLTEQMSDYLDNEKPYCVMEGICTEQKERPVVEDIIEDNIKTILYTGTLHRKFGVMHLLDAFSKIENDNYRLVICGTGDSENEIRAASIMDARIVFKGRCTREEVLGLQQKATVLVNPRLNNESFTKYSFPSKNLEYLSSGTPMIAFKLEGIPDEYDEYISYVGDHTVESFRDILVKVCELSEETRKEMGQRAKKFVLEQKNEMVQTRKIIELLEQF